MSQLVQVAEIAGTTRADVVRVATHGGTSASDWAIAHAIQQVTGRPAADIMWAGRAREAEPETPAPANPNAEYDPAVTIYPENTSPDEPRQVAAHHPGDHAEDVEDTSDVEAGRVAAQTLADQVFADLAEVLDNPRAAHRLTRAWTTPAEGRQVLVQVLEVHAGTYLRTEIAARQITAELAA